MTAIKTAAEIFRSRYTTKKLIICTDSLSSVESLKSYSSNTNPNILTNTLNSIYQTNAQTTILWVPSHIGINGNESADKLATRATSKPIIDIKIPFELNHIKQISKKITRLKWKNSWQNQSKIEHYFQINPNLDPSQFKTKNRHEQRTIFRLRSGYTLLNHNLFIMGIHPTGLCDKCKVPETVTHFITECKSELVNKLKAKCAIINAEFKIETILNNQILLHLIETENKRHL
jgi:hypothetical protein